MTPTLLVAALHAEALPLLRRMRCRHRHGRGLWAGELAGRPVLLLRCGVGRARAERATARVLAEHPAGRILSLGTCGALVDALPVSTLVSATAILDAPPLAQPPLGGVARPVVLATVPRVVADAASRSAWAERGAEVCEMEAAGVLAAAGGRPFHTLKVVSDLAGARPPKLRGVPRSLRISAFQVRAYRLVDQHLAPALEAWLPA